MTFSHAARITNYILLIKFSLAVSSAVYYAKHFLSVAEVMEPNNSSFPFHSTPGTLRDTMRSPPERRRRVSEAGPVSWGGCSRDFARARIREMFLPVSVWSDVILIQMAAVQHSAASSNKAALQTNEAGARTCLHFADAAPKSTWSREEATHVRTCQEIISVEGGGAK